MKTASTKHKEVTGYDIHATDGDIGEVEDFIIDDKLENPFSYCGNRQLVFGKKVIISPLD
jgi:hypothetical protein